MGKKQDREQLYANHRKELNSIIDLIASSDDITNERLRKLHNEANRHAQIMDRTKMVDLGVFIAERSKNLNEALIGCERGLFPEEPPSKEEANLCKMGAREYFKERKKA